MAHAPANPRHRRRSVGRAEAGDPAGRVARSRPGRGRGPGHGDLAQSRRDAAGGQPGRAGVAAGVGFRRGGRSRGRRRQRAEGGDAGRRIIAERGLGRAGQLPQPRGRRIARRGQRCAGLDPAGRRADGIACVAAGRAIARAQGLGQRGVGRGRASRLPACGRGRGLGVGACAAARDARGGGPVLRRPGRARPRSRRGEAERALSG